MWLCRKHLPNHGWLGFILSLLVRSFFHEAELADPTPLPYNPRPPSGPPFAWLGALLMQHRTMAGVQHNLAVCEAAIMGRRKPDSHFFFCVCAS